MRRSQLTQPHTITAYLAVYDALFYAVKMKKTGADYEHRRDWIEKRILKLGQIFCIDVCAYAVMSNHYPIVLHLNVLDQKSRSMNEILSRWQSLYGGNQLVARCLREEIMCDAELQVVKDLSEQWRERLADLSWFMRALNEGIAREANVEDGCTGRLLWKPSMVSTASRRIKLRKCVPDTFVDRAYFTRRQAWRNFRKHTKNTEPTEHRNHKLVTQHATFRKLLKTICRKNRVR